MTDPPKPVEVCGVQKGIIVSEQTLRRNWFGISLPLALTLLVVGAALAVAFS
jgi:hypothetical protein